jgi:predicted choloylglycine hydrolase
MTRARAAILWGALLGALAPVPPLSGCTILNVTGCGGTWVAANEDWSTDRFSLRVQPARGAEHGRVLLGVDDPERFPFSGLNDQGLFFDLASVPVRRLAPDPAKETHDNPIYVRMLASCSDVAEAVDFLARFNVSGLARHHVVVVDRSGSSAVIEGTPEGQVAIRKAGRYQLITNFRLSTADAAARRCDRFAVADRMLREMGEPTLDALRSILGATRSTSPQYPTVHSTIVDLSHLRLHLYYKGDLDRGVVLDVGEALRRGRSQRRLSSLFAARAVDGCGRTH